MKDYGYRYQDVTDEARTLIERGVASLRRINEHENFANWMEVGTALVEMRRAAQRLAGGLNVNKGPHYNAAYKVIAEANPDLAAIDSATRTHAVWCADHRSEIERWHATLASNIRQMVNHPTTIKRRYEAEHAIPGPAGNGAKPASGGGLKSEVMRLQTELDTARRELERLRRTRETVSEGTDWTWTDDADAIAEVWMRLQPNKAPRIASKVLELAKSTARKPRGKVNREPASERHWDR